MACGNVSPCRVFLVFALTALMGAPIKLLHRHWSEMCYVDDCVNSNGSHYMTQFLSVPVQLQLGFVLMTLTAPRSQCGAVHQSRLWRCCWWADPRYVDVIPPR